MTPCRIADTRSSGGSGFPTGPFGPPNLQAAVTRTFPILQSSNASPAPAFACADIPSIAQAYSFDITVVNTGASGFLVAWPSGQAQPFAATMAWPTTSNTILSYAAIVAAGVNGAVDVFANITTDIVIDLNGYFAAPTDFNDNTAVGLGTLAANTTGGDNTAVGFNAMLSNGIGGSDTAIGWGAMQNNSTASDNTAVGVLALGNYNTGGNTAVGWEALVGGTPQSGNTGGKNTAVGAQALANSSTANLNTAIGYEALQGGTPASANSGNQNTASGAYALLNNTVGFNNTASGAGALQNNTIGENNTAVGVAALLDNITGSNNIAVGIQAGKLVTGGSNIDIGNPGTSSDNGVVRIGTGNQISFFVAGVRGVTTGDSDAIPVVIDSNGQLGTVSSSRRFKEDIEDMGQASHDLMRLRPVTFRYKKPFADGSKPIQFGLIAEEVDEVYPDLVAHSADGQIETVKYQVLDSMLLNELQNEHRQIEHQAETIRLLAARLAALEQLLPRETPSPNSAHQ
jgi:hypothetical protein